MAAQLRQSASPIAVSATIVQSEALLEEGRSISRATPAPLLSEAAPLVRTSLIRRVELSPVVSIQELLGLERRSITAYSRGIRHIRSPAWWKAGHSLILTVQSWPSPTAISPIISPSHQPPAKAALSPLKYQAPV